VDNDNSENFNNVLNVNGDIVQNLDELNDNNNNKFSALNAPPVNFQANASENKNKGDKNNKYSKFYDEV
jgi:hypothetical protein